VTHPTVGRPRGVVRRGVAPLRLARLLALATALHGCGGRAADATAPGALPLDAVETCFIEPCRRRADLDGDRRPDAILQVTRSGKRGFAVRWGDRGRPTQLLGAGTVTPLRAMRDEADPDETRATAYLDALPDDLGHLRGWQVMPAVADASGRRVLHDRRGPILSSIPDVRGDGLALDDGGETWVLYLALDRTWSWIALGY
jgi:hypothetical protein